MRFSRLFSKCCLILSLLLPVAGCVSSNPEPHRKTSVWNEVKFGMSRDQVHKILGDPTEHGLPPEQEAWRQGPGASAWFFYVRYDANNKVLDYRSVYVYRTGT